jgi:dynactin complex subunit
MAEPAAQIKVGDHVLVNGKQKAVVKYIGEVEGIGRPGIWYGVELEERLGV